MDNITRYASEKHVFQQFEKYLGTGIEPIMNDVPKVFINGEIPTTKDDVEAEMVYISKTETFHAYLLIKCQGTTSMYFPKKNFTIKLYSDQERTSKLKKDFRGWGAQHKFCLKANFIDNTHARNIVCARLWSKACNTRSILNERIAMSPNNGAIDGFHIKVYNNGIYQGLYTWNIPKDGWMFGMESNGNEAVYCCEVQTEAGQFRQEVLADESDWSLEFPKQEEVNPSVLTGFNNLVHVVRDTTDEEFIHLIPTVLDIESAIDYYIFCYYFAAHDQLGKNMIMVTYDGGKTWIPTVYDNDSTWGSYWDGSALVKYNIACPEQYECSKSLLWERIETLFGEKLYARYLELTGTNGPWSLAGIISELESFYDVPEKGLYAEDKEIYETIPTAVTMGAMRNYMAKRKPYVDNCLFEIGVYVTLEDIKFQKDEITLGAGESIMLRIIFTPNNARNKKYTVTTDNNIVKIENNGEFVILTLDEDITLNQTINITVVSEESANLTGSMVIVTAEKTQSHLYPIISFDSKNYSNNTWVDSINGINITIDGHVNVSEDGVIFDGTQTFCFSTGNILDNIAVEFMGTIGDLVAGRNILSISPDISFSWDSIYGLWTSGNSKEIYAEYCTNNIIGNVELEDSKKFVHFLVCYSNQPDSETIIYTNIDGILQRYPGTIVGPNIAAAYIGNAEGNNHFVGTIRKLNVYNYIPNIYEAKEILGIPRTSIESVKITADMLELGSLSNVTGQLGSEVDWDEELRTNDYILIPPGAKQLVLDAYYGFDRVYFYNYKYSCISEAVARSEGELINIPENATYMKFLLMTTNPTDVNITFYHYINNTL